MSEENPSNLQQPLTIEEVGDFFESLPTIESNLEEGDIKSKKEEETLFNYNGELKDIDVWLKHEVFRLKKANDDSERCLREKNAERAYWFSAIWAIFIAVLILLHAMFKYFTLTQTEFIVVIGTLTASILTYYLLVIKYLFYRNNK
jgi:hypothetical protein